MKLKHTVMPLIAAAAAGLAGAACAEYPEKPVQFVVPWPPGGAEDVLTRIIADEFQAMYGNAAAVINKPGGGGGPFPGAVEVAAAEPDGHTVGSFVIGVPVVGPQTGIPELNPDPFEPVGIFMTYPFLIVAGKDAPYSSMAELADHARENPVVLGHFGAPLVPTQVTFGLADRLGFEFASDSAFDNLDCNTLASGDVDVMNTTMSLVSPCLKDLKVLATVTEERLALTPDAPAVAELAPDLDVVLWNGLFVPKGTPDDVIAKIESAAVAAINSSDALDYVAGNGAPLYWKDREASRKQILKDIETFGALTQ